jgi:hypothetical protein
LFLTEAQNAPHHHGHAPVGFGHGLRTAFTAIVPAADVAKMRALGFIGVMTHGMHHQEHHMMLARGEHPHG